MTHKPLDMNIRENEGSGVPRFRHAAHNQLNAKLGPRFPTPGGKTDMKPGGETARRASLGLPSRFDKS